MGAMISVINWSHVGDTEALPLIIHIDQYKNGKKVLTILYE